MSDADTKPAPFLEFRLAHGDTVVIDIEPESSLVHVALAWRALSGYLVEQVALTEDAREFFRRAGADFDKRFNQRAPEPLFSQPKGQA